MKKAVIAVLTAVLLLSFLILALSAAAEEEQTETMSREQLEEAYMPVLRAYQNALLENEHILYDVLSEYGGAIGFGGYFPENDPLYAFYDVNKDGVPEMLIGTGHSDDDFSVVQLFYLTEGEVEKYFDETYDYRLTVHIGTDGTIMTNGRSPVAIIGSTMDITTIGDSWSAPQAREGYYYDAIAGGEVSASDNGFNAMAQETFASLQAAGYVELSAEEMNDRLETYIADSLDLSSLDWYAFAEAAPTDELTWEALEGEHAYKVYRAPLYGSIEYGTRLTLDNDGDRFILTANLLEAWGTIVGTYTLDEQSLVLHVEYKNFAGWGYDDVTTVTLSVNGDAFIGTDYYFSIDVGSVFQYEGSYTVAGESGVGVVKGADVRMMDGPGADYTLLDVANPEIDETVVITGRCDNWYQVLYGTSVTVGYMPVDGIETSRP